MGIQFPNDEEKKQTKFESLIVTFSFVVPHTRLFYAQVTKNYFGYNFFIIHTLFSAIFLVRNNATNMFLMNERTNDHIKNVLAGQMKNKNFFCQFRRNTAIHTEYSVEGNLKQREKRK